MCLVGRCRCLLDGRFTLTCEPCTDNPTFCLHSCILMKVLGKSSTGLKHIADHSLSWSTIYCPRISCLVSWFSLSHHPPWFHSNVFLLSSSNLYLLCLSHNKIHIFIWYMYTGRDAVARIQGTVLVQLYSGWVINWWFSGIFWWQCTLSWVQRDEQDRKMVYYLFFNASFPTPQFCGAFLWRPLQPNCKLGWCEIFLKRKACTGLYHVWNSSDSVFHHFACCLHTQQSLVETYIVFTQVCFTAPHWIWGFQGFPQSWFTMDRDATLLGLSYQD